MLKYFMLFAGLILASELASCSQLEPAIISWQRTSFPAPNLLPQTTATGFTTAATEMAQEAMDASVTALALTSSPVQSNNNLIDPTPTPKLNSPCDRAAPGDPLDVSIADDTHLLPGQAFSKTWRLVNDGACAWTQDYSIVFFSGSQMNAKAQNNLPEETQPGSNIDISLDMIAPQQPGVYQGNWKLSNAKGQLFGLGPDGDAPFWVRIVVVEPSTDTPIPPPPTATATTTPVVYVSGEVMLKSKEYLDLDTRTISTGTISDVYYLAVDIHTHRLQPVNNAMLGAPGDPTPPTYSDCQSANLSTDPLVLDGLAVNTTFCYRTNLGLPGWARLVSIDPTTNVLILEILTWTIP